MAALAANADKLLALTTKGAAHRPDRILRTFGTFWNVILFKSGGTASAAIALQTIVVFDPAYHTALIPDAILSAHDTDGGIMISRRLGRVCA